MKFFKILKLKCLSNIFLLFKYSLLTSSTTTTPSQGPNRRSDVIIGSTNVSGVATRPCPSTHSPTSDVRIIQHHAPLKGSGQVVRRPRHHQTRRKRRQHFGSGSAEDVADDASPSAPDTDEDDDELDVVIVDGGDFEDVEDIRTSQRRRSYEYRSPESPLHALYSCSFPSTFFLQLSALLLFKIARKFYNRIVQHFSRHINYYLNQSPVKHNQWLNDQLFHHQ